MENLNKENFFNVAERTYPYAITVFKNWIDKYKKENNWYSLFAGTTVYRTGGIPEFHDLPFDMQSGIFMRFAADQMKGKKEEFYIGESEMMGLVTQLFNAIENDETY